MTPSEEAALAQRRWIISRLVASGVFLVLVVIAFLLIGLAKLPTVGFTVLIVAIVARIAFPFVADRLANRGLPTTQPTDPDGLWWYNHRTKQVEHGRMSLGSERDGPYASREEAERAPEIARERAAKWNSED